MFANQAENLKNYNTGGYKQLQKDYNITKKKHKK